ncbi:hypothetical protein GF337_12315 [candidate division KSB1 bacterium]|nr:hypothetical protein [candidate division KSB1 bacterium]
MKKSVLPFVLTSMLFLATNAFLIAQNSPESTDKPAHDQYPSSSKWNDDLSITGQWFLSYLAGEKKGTEFNQFDLKRGYINIRKKFSQKISVRMTPDISVDREGDGEGDIEMRLKYCYLKYSLPNLSFFTTPYLEFGLVHRPWIDFEQEINRYRVQGTMFLERIGMVNSGDYGVTFISDLGGTLSDELINVINSPHTGKWGSFAIGLYNGGGYHGLEKNMNKTLETRVSVRPLSQFFPYLQLSYYGAYGKGNTEAAPDWVLNCGFISLEQKNAILTAMYSQGRGNYTGTLLNNQDESMKHSGYSLYTEILFLNRKFSIIGRYDYNDLNPLSANNPYSQRYIAGLAYHFSEGCKILIDYDNVCFQHIDEPNEKVFEFAVELRY